MLAADIFLSTVTVCGTVSLCDCMCLISIVNSISNAMHKIQCMHVSLWVYVYMYVLWMQGMALAGPVYGCDSLCFTSKELQVQHPISGILSFI